MIRRSNLPRPLTSFIGREKEIQQVLSLVSQSRLVTITGPGGVGKTRLAIQAAEALKPDFPDGVWWVELAALSELVSSRQKELAPAGLPSQPLGLTGPQAVAGEQLGVDLVAQAAAKALRIPGSPGQPILDTIKEHLHEKKAVLVLDNCEHLIDACAALVEPLLSECPQVSILSTSREGLGVPGERAWILPSLSLPEQGISDFSKIIRSEAISLFIERTADVLPGYHPNEVDAPIIAQICTRLDGIPLAIELAAARMHLLTASEIASRLDSRFSLLTSGRRTALHRHQTLRAAIEWSYDLLSPPEQVLFRRLSVFAGSFSLEAAEFVCAGGEIRSDETLTLLGRLVDKSLLQVEANPDDREQPTRYRFLDTIQSYARLMLEEVGETRSLRDRHAAFFVDLVEAAEPELLSYNQIRWYKLLRSENDNLRAVIEWSAESDQAEHALRVAGALLWFWFRSGSNREASNLALRALTSPSSYQFTTQRGRALNTAGFFLCLLGETGLAQHYLEEAITLLRTTDDQASLSWSLQFLGLVLANEKKYDLADASFQEGLAISRQLVNTKPNSFAHFLGDVELFRGDRARAKNIYEESAAIFRSIGNLSFLAYPLRRLGYLALEQNEIQKAWAYFQESLAFNHLTRDYPGLTASITSFAVLAMRLDKPVIAARLYGTVEHRLESLSITMLQTDQAELGKLRSHLQAGQDPEAFDAFSEGWEMSDEQAIELAQTVYRSDK